MPADHRDEADRRIAARIAVGMRVRGIDPYLHHLDRSRRLICQLWLKRDVMWRYVRSRSGERSGRERSAVSSLTTPRQFQIAQSIGIPGT